MTENEALAKLVAPGQPRPGTWRQGTIQILVTRACDNSCYGCTQGSNLGGKPVVMTPEQFDTACRSLRGYLGVVGVFGGNPALHPQFSELCRILAAHIPFEQRGIWCNHPRGHAKLMRETFNPNYSNLNVHLNREAYTEFRRDWPEAAPFGLDDDSRHSPVHLAMKDVIEDEGTRWSLIADCDLNQRWSALIGVFRGELRAWFCEIAGAQSMLHQDDPDYPDTGVPVVAGCDYGKLWWRQMIHVFRHQVRKHCHECGVPLKGFGQLAIGGSGPEQTSATHAGIFRPKRRGRAVEVVTDLVQLGRPVKRVTDYIPNGRI